MKKVKKDYVYVISCVYFVLPALVLLPCLVKGTAFIALRVSKTQHCIYAIP